MKYTSSIVQIGSVALGGDNPIRVQSMTTTNTMDTFATVDQIKELVLAGCDFVRVTTRNIKEAENLKNIKQILQQKGFKVPLIADVHFNPKVAEVAARIVEKVRINPGNYISKNILNPIGDIPEDKEYIENINHNLSPLLDICKEKSTAIRIGVNHGSLSERILYKFGNTPIGMVESIMEFVHVCKNNDFHNLVLSLKASSVTEMIEANLLLVKKLADKGLNYPIHLGVTEAGSGEDGRVKSAAGIGYLLAHGIGDTIRVSLTEDPIYEVPIAKTLVDFYGKRKNLAKHLLPEIIYLSNRDVIAKPPLVVTSEDSNLSDISLKTAFANRSYPEEKELQVPKFNYPGIIYNDLIIRASVEVTLSLYNHVVDGLCIENDGNTSADQLAELILNILQVLGLRISKTDYIACPTCGRSTINVIEHLDNVKKYTSHLSGLRIAIMGCIVNGPGEMKSAHYGYVGTQKGKVSIYKGNKLIHQNVPQEIAIQKLIGLIKENGDWKDVPKI